MLSSITRGGILGRSGNAAQAIDENSPVMIIRKFVSARYHGITVDDVVKSTWCIYAGLTELAEKGAT
jgi:hypothetical protein